MENMKDKTAIVGVGYTPQGKVPGRSSLSFHVEAARNAIEDAGLGTKDVDGLLIQPSMGDPSVTAVLVAQHLGIRPRFLCAHDAFGASAACQAQHAAWAVASGLANYVVCTYGENARSGSSKYGSALNGGLEYGMFGAASAYALAARRGMHEFGTGPETWAEIAVGQRKWANLNPRAYMYEKQMTYDDYYNSKKVIEPFRLFDICLITDGGRAFIVTTAERARDCKKTPVFIMGMGQDHPATNTPQADYLAGPTGAKRSGEQAYKMAQISKDEVDACEIYDCFTYTVELELADYGFFRNGEGKDFLKAERIGPGGDFPMNTSGGLLSESYQQGFTPLTEAVVQLRREAGERQLGPATKTKEPEIILVSNNGGALQTHSTLILRR
ncbi:MAG: thiolase family protein [Deltaproteobacteria bacterium]|nr:thiolase family protein [Deltaproteobacteria bacterium]